jgi:hypothetical protein
MNRSGWHTKLSLDRMTPREELDEVWTGIIRLRERVDVLDERLRMCGLWLIAQVGSYLSNEADGGGK